jgi:thiamine transport system substrate-binding protein
MTRNTVFLIILVGMLLSGPASQGAAAEDQPILRILTHDSFSASKDVISDFENSNHAKLQFITGGDAGETLNKAILSKDNPLADVIYGVDNTFASRALSADILAPYSSPLLSQLPAGLRIDPSNRLLPVDFGYVCLIYDKGFFEKSGLPVPATLSDLAKPAYKSLLVVENPATSSPGLAFLLATVATFGETGGSSWLDFWRDLRKNDVLVVNGWSDAYNNEFSATGKGRRPIMVSYATDPAADIFFASEPKPEQPRVAVITPPQGSFRQIEFVGILKGAKAQALARAWIDYMLSVKFQQDIPLQMFVYPANENAKLPDLFVRFAPVPSRPAVLDPAAIGKNRDDWIKRWTQTVLR